MASDQETPSPHFGDYPHGAYWSTERRGASEPVTASYEVSGTVIRFMPEDTVTVPLWDEDGLLPDEPHWLNRALGLTPGLVKDIAAWGNDWNAARRGEHTATQLQERQAQLDAEARLLVERLRSELPDTFSVVYRP